MVDVELLQTGQVCQPKVLQLLDVVLLQVKSHQAAQRRQAHGADLSRERKTPIFVMEPQACLLLGPRRHLCTCVKWFCDRSSSVRFLRLWSSALMEEMLLLCSSST